MMQTFTFFSRPLAGLATGGRVLRGAALALALTAAAASSAWATTFVVTNPVKNDAFVLNTNDVLTINSNVNFGGSITVQGNNTVINNFGSISNNGVVTVNSGTTGTVINNQGTVPSQNVFLNATTTINNGSATETSGVTWTGYVGNRFTVAPVINNFAVWTGQIQPLPGGTINNKSGANWNAYMTVSASLTVSNEGSWNSQVQPSGNPTFTFTNAGTWAGLVSANGYTTSVTNTGIWSGQIDYSGSLTILNSATGTWTGLPNGNSGTLAITNGGTWTKGGFNFPSTGPNTFVNQAGATASFNATLGLNGATSFVNSGTLSLNQSSLLPNGASITNNAGAVLTLPLGSGSPATFTNAGTITNNGRINATSGAFTNSGTINNGRALIAVTGNFTNAGTITGPAAPLRGSITATAISVNSGTFGVTGQLDFCDAGSPANGFDTAGGTIGSATTFCLNNPLPVELTSFAAQADKGKVQIRWSTATERNSAAFVVERSATGDAFAAVAETRAQGNSTRAVEYVLVDANPLPGTSYYRLRQLDADGTVSYSKVATVSVAAFHQPVDFYPNPASDRLTLDLTAVPAAPCEVRLLSLTGQAVLAATLAGGRAQELPLAGVPAGLYLLHVRTAQGSTVRRVEKR
ncbi:T9SS type A sorting domain-containing protein [Hymenobacter armeniacus]|uniref:T9SS type A sorting domain-containing protein n=1 Tax=Hymenobacter armeniacus TaxID=2771358 RepID=A0ABR8JXC7_9BACT|nr:T9SS type A sorting domain-containing protein [Hymenobacter armeniacus]MBD2724612.1 T9SS type A sorting domain-containing protein [Hymenobacter armeniacus]